MSNHATRGRVGYAALLPHAPILIPGVGGPRGKEVASTVAAMREAARRAIAIAPDALVVISPHSPREPKKFGIWTADRLVGTLRAFGASHEGIDLPNDALLAKAIAHECAQRGVPMASIAARTLDHGATVPLWFVAEAGWGGPSVVLGLNSADQPAVVALGEAIAGAVASAGKRVTLIASGDMSHRLTANAPCGFHRRGLEFDRCLLDTLRRGDYSGLLNFSLELRNEAAEDALDSMLVALGAVNFKSNGAEVLNYEGPFGVGYCVAILYCDEEFVP